MSVINKMLRDLEQNNPSLNTQHSQIKKFRSHQVLVKSVIYLLLIIVAVLVTKIYWVDDINGKQQQPIAKRTKTDNLQNLTSKAAQPKSNNIKSLNGSISVNNKKNVLVTNSNKNKPTQAILLTQTNTGATVKADIKTVVTPSHREKVELQQLKKKTQVAVIDIKVSSKKNNTPNKPFKKTSTFSININKTDPKKQARYFWRLAEENPYEAEKNLQQAIALDPQLHGARLQLIAYQISKRKMFAVEQSVNKALKLFPKNARYIEWKARLLLVSGKKQLAREWLLKMSPKLKSHINYYGMLAGINNQLGMYAEAENIYIKLVLNQPDHGPWLLGLAIAQQKQRKTISAKRSYLQAIMGEGLTNRAKLFIQQQLKKLEL